MAFERSKPRKSPSIMALGDFRRLKVPINSFEEAHFEGRPMLAAYEKCGLAGVVDSRHSSVSESNLHPKD
jgi:hypothetical protein